ncbi:MAG: DNA mismatch repair endonuclease MutL [Chloroflexi bacterium]|nr:DNA mismatch repair endonuclease MutL [Chloroflexota bacterium]
MSEESRNPIRLLTPEVVGKIAAGEAVERPASVVKELLENAIDAGATDIRVEVRQGGQRLIAVSDNGCGIPGDEVEMAFTRHATSKLRDAEDLEGISTLGFRGEALASIAAVAQLTILTRTRDAHAARRLRVEGGRLVHHEPGAAPAGTLVSVENLFYNVPARRKFLRQPTTESAHVHDVVTHYAMAYPERRLELQVDGRSVFLSPGSGQLADVLVSTLGLDTTERLIAVDEANDGLRVHGYVSTAALHRATRADITFFVNRRWISDRSLTVAVTQAYHTLLPLGRYPLAVLLLEMPPDEVDVNVHPTKREVRFRHGQRVFAQIQSAVRRAVSQQAPVAATFTRPEWAAPPRGQWGQAGAGASPSLPHSEPGRPTVGPASSGPLWESPAVMPPLRVIGQVAQTYIIAEGPDGLYLIDQHAAHERVLYERLLHPHGGESRPDTQTLMQPLTVTLAPRQAATLHENLPQLQHFGFALEPFGGETWLMRGVPAVLHHGDPTRALVDILDEIGAGNTPLQDSQEARVVASICKQVAVKGGQSLSQQEMRELVQDLERTSMPRTCPHGRPTMIHLSANLLARQFGRG